MIMIGCSAPPRGPALYLQLTTIIMNHTQLAPDDLELIWAQVLARLDHYASRSPSFDDFSYRVGWSGWSFRLEEERQIAGFIAVQGARGVEVTVHRLDGQDVGPDLSTMFSLKGVWTALTVHQLALY